MKHRFSYSTICFPVAGSLSVFAALDAGELLAIVWLVGGVWLVGISLFEVDHLSLGPVGMLGLTGLGLWGGFEWRAAAVAAGHWVAAWTAFVFWFFENAGSLLTGSSRLLGRHNSLTDS